MLMTKVFFISKKSVKDAWITAVIKVLNNGVDIKTEYDRPEDPPSKDATVLIEVTEPMSDPIKRNDKLLKIRTKYGNSFEVYGAMGDTYLIGSIQGGYIEEIMDGVNDNFIWESATSFPYSYHDRIFNYAPFSLEDTIHVEYDVSIVDNEDVKKHQKLIKAHKIEEKKDSTIWKIGHSLELDLDKKIEEQIGIKNLPIAILKFPRINQINYIIDKLKKKPYSRRAQAITWRPLVDPFHSDPPCLQRIYMRIINGKLTMQTTWRSRDLFRAWEANVNGMIRIQKKVAEELGVEIGNYVDFCNSLHIYGSTIPEVKDMLNRMKNKGEIPEELLEYVK